METLCSFASNSHNRHSNYPRAILKFVLKDCYTKYRLTLESKSTRADNELTKKVPTKSINNEHIEIYFNRIINEYIIVMTLGAAMASSIVS